MQVFNEFARRHYYFISSKPFATVLHEIESTIGITLHADVEGELPDGFLSHQGYEYAISIYDKTSLPDEKVVLIQQYGKV